MSSASNVIHEKSLYTQGGSSIKWVGRHRYAQKQRRPRQRQIAGRERAVPSRPLSSRRAVKIRKRPRSHLCLHLDHVAEVERHLVDRRRVVLLDVAVMTTMMMVRVDGGGEGKGGGGQESGSTQQKVSLWRQQHSQATQRQPFRSLSITILITVHHPRHNPHQSTTALRSPPNELTAGP